MMMNGDTAASTSSSSNDENIQVDALMDSNDGEDVTLSALVIRALKAADDILEGSGSSTITAKDKETQLTSVLSSLSLCSSLIRHLSLLSSNETIDEVSTPTLRCFLVPYYTALCEMQTRTKDYNARIKVLNLAKDQLQGFMDKVEQYAVVDYDKRKRLYLEKGSLGNDPARRREAKILQYKEEKTLKAQIDVSLSCNTLAYLYHILNRMMLSATQCPAGRQIHILHRIRQRKSQRRLILRRRVPSSSFTDSDLTRMYSSAH